MDTTVERLKVGTQVIIGSYGVNNDEPHPVVWLKRQRRLVSQNS